jgi:formimidoylglutamate deiminase
MTEEVLEADLTWVGTALEPGVRVAIGPAGRISSVGPGGAPTTRRLRDTALLPGFVNAHSHAFQRALRGSGELFPAGTGSFWTWREAMYALVERLDRDSLARICRQAFAEMRDAGTTAVGEFHYLHHDRPDDFAFDAVVLAAAAEVGIRVVLLQTYYATGGIGRPLAGGQRRFSTQSVDDFLARTETLAAGLRAGTQSVGLVAHSVRAVRPEDIARLHQASRERGMPFHIHVEEQQGEIDECLAAYGKRPMAVLCDAVSDAGNITAIHCTHTLPADLARYVAAGGRICCCPLTEGNLGDGIPDLRAVPATWRRLCLGSDSNLRIAPIEDMRWLEYGQRLRGELRGALPDAAGAVAPTLLAAATEGGAAALGLEAGRIAPGAWADLVAIDLTVPNLRDIPPDRMLDAHVFGAGNEAIAGTWVGGAWRPTGGRAGERDRISVS